MKFVTIEIVVPDKEFPILEDDLTNNLFPNWGINQFAEQPADEKQIEWYWKWYREEEAENE